MAAASVPTSIAAELLHKMNPYKYKEYCATINEADSVSIAFYKASKWVEYFALDTAVTFRNGKMNSDHVYEYFGQFNGVSANTVRKNLLAYVSGNLDFVTRRSSVCLPMRSIDVVTWIDNINNGKPCDELALLTLSAMYHRHSLVVTKNKTWCSIESPKPMSLLNAMSTCTVRLLYLGDLTFGVLKWKPQIPKPVVAKPHLGEFKIVEEYTLDDQQSSFKKLAVVRPTPVETATCSKEPDVDPGLSCSVQEKAPSEVVPPTSSYVKDSQPKILYAAENTGFYVETSPSTSEQESVADTISPESYPWKKKLCVSVRRLSDFEISYWTGDNTQDAGKFPIKLESNPEELSPATSELMNTSTRSHLKEEPIPDAPGPAAASSLSTEKLLARAKSLIKGISNALGTSDEPKTKRHTVVANPTPNITAGSPLPTTSSKGQVPVETRSDRQLLMCQMCEHTCTSMTALSNHHRSDHGVVKCDYCKKAFASKASLDKHMHMHMNAKSFVCEECGQGFPFKSRLLQHQITHDTESHFMCKRGTCNKSFKNKGDLTRHEGTHDDKWYFCSYCSYKNKDKRNRDSHLRTHEVEGNERYHCDKCGKRMRFSTQMKRHREAGCDLSTFHV